MNKLTVIQLALLCSTAAYGQSTVNFANNSSTLVTIFNGSAGIASPDQGYSFELFAQPDNGEPAPAGIGPSGALGNWVPAVSLSPSLPSPDIAHIIPVNSPNFGIFNGPVAKLPGIAGGAEAWLQIVAWSGNEPDLATALSQPSPPELFGFSAVWSQVTGDNEASPPTVPPSIYGPGEFTGLVLQPLNASVPDATSTLALSGITTAALLLFRHRK